MAKCDGDTIPVTCSERFETIAEALGRIEEQTRQTAENTARTNGHVGDLFDRVGDCHGRLAVLEADRETPGESADRSALRTALLSTLKILTIVLPILAASLAMIAWLVKRMPPAAVVAAVVLTMSGCEGANDANDRNTNGDAWSTSDYLDRDNADRVRDVRPGEPGSIARFVGYSADGGEPNGLDVHGGGDLPDRRRHRGGGDVGDGQGVYGSQRQRGVRGGGSVHRRDAAADGEGLVGPVGDRGRGCRRPGGRLVGQLVEASRGGIRLVSAIAAFGAAAALGRCVRRLKRRPRATGAAVNL